jgi:hypothetical protein
MPIFLLINLEYDPDLRGPETKRKFETCIY